MLIAFNAAFNSQSTSATNAVYSTQKAYQSKITTALIAGSVAKVANKITLTAKTAMHALATQVSQVTNISPKHSNATAQFAKRTCAAVKVSLCS